MSETYTNPENEQSAESFADFIDRLYHRNPWQNIFNEYSDKLLETAIDNGYIYDAEGNAIKSADRLQQLKSDWENALPENDKKYLEYEANLPPIYFHDPADKDGKLYFYRRNGNLSGVALAHTAEDLIANGANMRITQPTPEMEVPEMTALEAIGNFFSFFQWKPTRIRQAERNNAISRMERLKIAENMGYPIDAAEKAKYAELWDLTPEQKQAYINNKTLPKKGAAMPAEVKDKKNIQPSKSDRLRDESVKEELPKIQEKLDALKTENPGNEYQYGFDLVQSYLDTCGSDPAPGKYKGALDTLMTEMNTREGDFKEFIKAMGTAQTTGEQFAEIMNAKMPASISKLLVSGFIPSVTPFVSKYFRNNNLAKLFNVRQQPNPSDDTVPEQDEMVPSNPQ